MDVWHKRWIAYKRVLRECDVVLQVVDARAPAGTLNRGLSRYMSKMIIVVNKSDLVPPQKLDELPRVLRGYRGVAVSSKTGGGFNQLFQEIKGVTLRRPIKVAVVGYPNVGKSSMMNRLARRKATKVSPVPGETKNVQWISLGDILLCDTPGIVPPGETGLGLVLKAAVSADKAHSPEPIALDLISKKPSAAAETYGIAITKADTAEKILEKIAKRRGKLLKGGELDLQETARMVVRDYQRGKLVI